MAIFGKPISLIVDYWNSLPSICKKIVIGTGIYFGITSLMTWSVGYMINNSIWCKPQLRSKRTFDGTTYAIVTGSNQGIGFQIAKSLMLSGCNVIMACRNEKRANNAINKLLNISKQYIDNTNHGKLLFIPLDLASKTSIDTFIDKLLSLNIECNILIHNANMVITEGNVFSKEDNMNIMWQINYLSQFYLTLSLLSHIIDVSKKYKYGRIINVNSFAHIDGKSDDIEYFMDDTKRNDASYLDEKINTNGVGLYGSNKLASIMYIDKLYQYIKKNYNDSQDILKYFCVCCVHPGIVDTETLRKDWKISTPFLYYQWYLFALLSAEQGAIQVLHAVHSDIDNDKYLVNGKYHTNGLYVELDDKTKGLIQKYQNELWNKSLEIWPISQTETTSSY